MNAPTMRVLPALDGQVPERSDEWLRRAVPQGRRSVLVHVSGDPEDAPGLAAVVDALRQTQAFRQAVLAPPARELAEHGVSGAAAPPAGAERIHGLEDHLDAADVVLVHGCDEVALVGAIAAARRRIPVVHVGRAAKSGEVGGLVDRLADLVLVHDQQDVERLERLHVARERIVVVGNPLIDAVRAALRDAVAHDVATVERLKPRAYVLAILTGTSSPEGIGRALAAVAAKAPLVVVADQPLGTALAAGTRQIASPRFSRRLALIRSAGAILTNSERVVDEAAAIGARCHTVGLSDSPARPVPAVHLGADLAAVAALRPHSDAPAPCAVPLWDGRAGVRIADAMLANFARLRMPG